MHYVTSFDQLKKERFYNKVRLSNYSAEDYLKGVNCVRKDYQDLVNEYQNKDDVVFLVDPPYLSTDTATYSRPDYWKLTDYLNVLKAVKDVSYFYFTSNKSQIIELCEWMQSNEYCKNPFDGAVIVEAGTHLTHNASYTDIIMYRNNVGKM
ncbi:hypothetical protein [Chryseobacterium nematophagum]|uniref:hypothetical protein n=1 Tax=Chryseobacterium nematophagum TaxID=2305228 RepID=UPI001E560695|nr:hypothetical protein [Chryseobacterium nematophagum]